MVIIGIDPGTTESGYTAWDADKAKLLDYGKLDNNIVIDKIREHKDVKDVVFVIEGFKSYGMIMGQSTIDSIFWSGRFAQEITYITDKLYIVPRKTCVTKLCGVAKAKDGNVSRRLKDLFGEKGTKKNPGILYGISKDAWSALSYCVYIAMELGYKYEEDYKVGL